MLDTYNQQIQEGVSCTIRTNINTANHHFVVEEAKIIKEGNYSPSGHNASSIVSTQGIAPAVMENHGTVTAIKEPQVLTPKRTEFGKAVRKQYENKKLKMSRHTMQQLEPRKDGVTNTLTSVQKDNLLVEQKYRIRKLTPRECFRLMGVVDKDIDTIQGAGISNSQMYKMAGNSIVVDTLYHLFRKMFCEVENENDQLTLF